MDKQGRERRKHKRIPINLEISLQIVHPEDSLGTRSFHGRVSNINERDLRVTVFDLSSAQYQKLIRDRDLRYARMSCTFPTSETESRLYGRILYFDYHGKSENKVCEFALQFWELDDEEKTKLKAFVEYLKLRTGQME